MLSSIVELLTKIRGLGCFSTDYITTGGRRLAYQNRNVPLSDILITQINIPQMMVNPCEVFHPHLSQSTQPMATVVPRAAELPSRQNCHYIIFLYIIFFFPKRIKRKALPSSSPRRIIYEECPSLPTAG